MSGWPSAALVRRGWVRAGLFGVDTCGEFVRCRRELPGLSDIQRIYLHRPEELGDVVTVAPAARRVAELFAGAEITLGVREEMVEVAGELLEERVRVMEVEAAGQESFELALVFDGDLRKLWAVRGRTLCLAGFGVRGGSFLLDIEAPYRTDTHVTRRGVELVEEVYRRLMPGREATAPCLRRPAEGPREREGFTVLHPGCGREEKRMPAELWREIAEGLEQAGEEIALTGVTAERTLCGWIGAGLEGVMNEAGYTSLPDLARIVARAACVIAPDTGVIHLARGLGVPTVGLFVDGSRVREWGYDEPGHRTLVRPTAEQVLAARGEAISQRSSSRPGARAEPGPRVLPV